MRDHEPPLYRAPRTKLEAPRMPEHDRSAMWGLAVQLLVALGVIAMALCFGPLRH